MKETEFLVIGGGPSGLACATALAKNSRDVIVVERETEAGGIPRHCGHYPFGLREARRLFKGPDYAKWLVKEAQNAGVKILTKTTALSREGMNVSISSDDGLSHIKAGNLILASGVREASRAQRNIAGIKTGGVFSTGALQGLIYIDKIKPFTRPVILGSELVSYSAIETCRHMGIKPVAMVDIPPSPKVRAVFTPFPHLLGIPTHFNASQFEILGNDWVNKISFNNSGGKRVELECDGVIISGDFRPEATLVRNFDLEIDPNTQGPKVNQFAQTSEQNIFAIGNGLRAVETSGWCWSEGKALGNFLAKEGRPNTKCTEINIVSDKIKYVMPSRISDDATAPVLENLQIRLNTKAKGQLQLKLGEKIVASKKLNSGPERRIIMPLNSEIIAACRS